MAREETSLTSLGGSVVWIDFVEGTRVADRLPSPDKQALFDKAGERPLDVPSIHVECFDQVAGLCRLIPNAARAACDGFGVVPLLEAREACEVDDLVAAERGVPLATSYEFTNVEVDHTSRASFAVDVGPAITITLPTSGEAWRRGSTQVIR